MRHPRTSLIPFTALCGIASFAAPAGAQVKFSIDWNSPTVGSPDCPSGLSITEADVLIPCSGTPTLGPLPAPSVLLSGGALGLSSYSACLGHSGGTPCGIDVDAFSSGLDDILMPINPIQPSDLWFSVDEYAGGMPATPAPPAVWTEFPGGDSSADTFVNVFPLPPGPLGPFASPPGNTGLIDGDGLALGSPNTYPGVGLIEPNTPSFGPAAPGDNLDALDLGAPGAIVRYFSLDSSLIDPCTGIAASGSAAAHGVVGGDVLLPGAAGTPIVWAPATALGLDLVSGPDSDDLDALALWENGDGQFTPSMSPYDWAMPGSSTDMLLFSVSRGSAVVGMPDSLSGIPIEPGDILTTPLPASLGGVSPFPAIFIAAENIGLGTLRFGLAGACNDGDELDALTIRRAGNTLHDCDGNGVEDAIDIFNGTYVDGNLNGIPDICETPLIASPYCFCASGAPCGNNDALAGCQNSTGAGALLSASGTSSVSLDDLVLSVTGLPSFQFGVVFTGTAPIGPFNFGDGHRCVGGSVRRLGLQNSGFSGTFVYGPGLVAASLSTSGPIFAGSTWHFQGWYRDPGGPCASGHNLSNAISVTFY